MPITDCLNIGCGNYVYSNVVNLDKLYIKGTVTPNVIGDGICLPFKDDTFKWIVASHIIEHLSKEQHWIALSEWRRVLIPGGKANISLPEFDVCLQNFLDNYHGNRDYWYFTIFGANRYPNDRHLSGLTQEYLTGLLFDVGFGKLVWNKTGREFACMGVIATKVDKLPMRI